MSKERVTDIRGGGLRKYKRHSGRQERCLFSSQNGDPQCREIYTKRKNCKRAMVIAKAEALQEWYDKLNAKDGAKEVYKIAKMSLTKRKEVSNMLIYTTRH